MGRLLSSSWRQYGNHKAATRTALCGFGRFTWMRSTDLVRTPLGVMLHLCPRLRYFYISSNEERCDIDYNTTPPIPGVSNDPTLDLGDTLELEEFEVFHIYIEEKTLKSVIARSPKLRICRLVFHFSIRWHRLAKDDWTGFTSVTKQGRGGQTSGTFHPIRLTSPQDIVNQLANLNLDNYSDDDEMSVYHTVSLFSYDLHLIIGPYLQPIVNVVTTLEIQPTARPSYSIDVTLQLSHTLHDFLCTSLLLLHLKAPLVRYHTAFLDLRGDLDLNVRYQVLPSLPYYPRLLRWTHKRVWACRRLCTLQLYFFAEQKQNVEEDARILFGYISRVCLLLQDLAIQQQHLCVRLEGGLCLLSRLHRLERLSVVSSGNNSGFTKRDLVWMTKSRPQPPTLGLPRFREPKVQYRDYRRQLNQLVQRSVMTTVAKVDPVQVQEMHQLYMKAKDPNQQLTVEDLDGVGSVADLEAWRQYQQGYKDEIRVVVGRIASQDEEEEELIDLPYCWPLLKYFAFYRYQLPPVKRRKGQRVPVRQEDLDALDLALWDEQK
ncbi:hypothetical protein BGX29_010445 [Mortierella sp. GBA35]|nr:hypothetical protein BGX29_010445 [Mortierella sp. GBA35]